MESGSSSAPRDDDLYEYDELLVAEVTAVREAFRLFDTMASNSIPGTAIRPALAVLGHRPMDESLRRALVETRLLDPISATPKADVTRPTSDGRRGSPRIRKTDLTLPRVSLRRFLGIIQVLIRATGRRDALIEAFRAFDPDQSGVLSHADFVRVLTTFGDVMTEEEVRAIEPELAKFTADKNGIDYLEFARQMIIPYREGDKELVAAHRALSEAERRLKQGVRRTESKQSCQHQYDGGRCARCGVRRATHVIHAPGVQYWSRPEPHASTSPLGNLDRGMGVVVTAASHASVEVSRVDGTVLGWVALSHVKKENVL